jgi:Uma2 family endonuclease
MATLIRMKTTYLSRRLNGTLMTPQEFDAATRYDERYVYELIHGVLIVNPIPLESEVGPNEYLGYLLLAYWETHPQGAAMSATLPERYIATKDGRRRVDRLIWTGRGRLPDWEKELANIAVEFVSAARRDRVRDYEEKRDEYMALKLDEYWIIDRFQRIMTVYRSGGRGKKVIVVQENETYTTPLLPGFELPLKRILEIADKMQRPKKPRRR